ncbi:c-type cytochrome [Thauera linaloolentis]|uniref:Putative cytochrome c550 n=1 Tax=Thauera linaloolentis (strain DSM 12138 / JCM 21573 / CCUG 41526 / CIP 105981 / IAM 15112 / NBRC 102519 / 47Lol) TaxID=1123367 RepID=N6YYJ6_THAL4|nr:c-type cytochrome [Thauera linaloolentis]ENO87223.1 putative cytochrome c550 [Thauera linaloolentis 47Lol = DSM 12138]MCM8567376.1 c-type cytochrome [Thauera linaloolentis]
MQPLNSASSTFRQAPRTGLAATLGAVLCAALCCLPVAARAERPQPPVVDTSTLPPLAPGWAEANPLRGNAAAIELGRNAFNQACARCHGVDADGSRSPAPDLRRIGGLCNRAKDPALKQRCIEDSDHFFKYSVLNGKIKLGIEHMPPWEGIIDAPVLWSIRSFVESMRKPPPRQEAK